MQAFAIENQRTGYQYLDTLSLGESYDLFEVKDSSDHIFAMKIFKKRKYDSKLLNEIEKGIYINSKKEVQSFFVKYITSESVLKTKHTFIIYELAERKTLKDFLMIRQCFDEKLSLTIFKKIAELVDSLHKIGLTHTNLELDNFLLDANKNLKISGFSSMQFIQKEINDFQNDNFHLSILLFQLLTGKCYIKNQESQFLKIIQEGKLSFFWKSIELQNNQKFSEKIKNLINKMFQAKNIIIDLDEILNDNNYWFNNIQQNDFDTYIKNAFKNLEAIDESY